MIDLIDQKTDKVYVNEINTIPGALSYYLWEATGKSFEKELDEILDPFKMTEPKQN